MSDDLNDAHRLLSDEERAILNDPDTDPEEAAALASTNGSPDDAAGAQAAEQKADEALASAAGEQNGDPAGTDQTAADTAATADTAAAQKPATTQFKAELPADYQERLDATKSAAAELAQQFRDGNITFDEYEVKRAELDATREELAAARLKADMFAEINQQTAAQQWQSEVARFTAEAKTRDGIDYTADKARGEDLDLFVKTLASRQENADKDMRWFLDEAHKRVVAIHGKPQGAPATSESASNVAPNRKPATDKAPKTLADIPAAAGTESMDTGNEFAHLDALDGEALEVAMAKMTPAQRERYLEAS